MAHDSGNDEQATKDADLQELKKNLKEESNYVKDCFNRYSFQAIAMSGAGFLWIARYMEDEPAVGIVSIVIIILLLMVSRMGGYKYNTANRNDAYRLHLERTQNLPGSDADDGWKPELRYIGWQEAMRAWRVVQSTIYHKLYDYHGPKIRWLMPIRLHKNFRDKEIWFKPATLVNDEGRYYVGGYLRSIQLIIYLIAMFAFLVFIIALYEIDLKIDNILIKGRTAIIIKFTIGTLVFLAIAWRFCKDGSRRIQLESSLLCIHSSGILWQAVVLAHSRAKMACLKNNSYVGYTKALGLQAVKMIDLEKGTVDIYNWIDKPTPEIRILKEKIKPSSH